MDVIASRMNRRRPGRDPLTIVGGDGRVTGEDVRRARRFDPLSLITEVNERTGAGLRLVGMADRGESGGAAFVSWPDGRQAVVTRRPEPLGAVSLTAEVLELACGGDLPVPRHELVVALAEGVAVVQQRLPGRPAELVDVSVIDAMVAMNERFAGLLVKRLDVPIPPLYLRRSGPTYFRHETLARHSPRSRRLLQRIRQIGATEPHEMNGTDLLHADYSLGNVLFDATGAVSGVVDWGAARGDRHFALVGLRFDLAWSALDSGGAVTVEPATLGRLDDILTALVDPVDLRVYWAHWTLRQLDWTVSHHGPADIDLHLELGESRLL
ncbi:MAG: hypothetical protein QOG10_6006 [Kribbellaceae bacterium]|nr:hypothetical protein [Kribbellaceae bacterium]